MRFIDLNGRSHTMDIRPSAWPRRSKEDSRSYFQWSVGEVLARQYPNEIILEEFPCCGEHLTLDFFLPRKRLAIEAQGQQHGTFNPFYHADKGALKAQCVRDRRKAEWCEVNSIRLITVQYTTDETAIERILSS